MTTMAQFERNVIRSFQTAKEDIYKLYEFMNSLNERVEYLTARNTYLTQQITDLSLQVTKKRAQKIVKVAKQTKKKYIASLSSNKLHESNCAFAKNIKPKNKRSFASKNAALNVGYKVCKCVA